MTEKEAKKWLRAISATQRESNHTSSLEVRKEALYMAIQALEEIQAYRAIGTVEEFKALKEKEERFDRNIKMFNSIGLEIRNKAIDEFAERMKDWMLENYGLSEKDIQEIDEIAEQLKGGAERPGKEKNAESNDI